MIPVRARDLGAIVVASFLLTACSGGGARTGVTASIGAGGGTIEIPTGPIAGAKIVIPDDALAAPVDLSLHVAIDRPLPAQTFAVGPVVQFGPIGITFAKTIEVTLPYTRELVPITMTDDDFVILHDTGNGGWNYSSLTALGHDFPLATTASTNATGYYVVAVIVPALIHVAEYLPLLDDTELEFDDGTVIRIVDAPQEPNITDPDVMRFEIDGGQGPFGYYWRRNGLGQTVGYGRFDGGRSSWQELALVPINVTPTSILPNGMIQSYYEFQRFRPFGRTKPSDWGTAALELRFRRSDPVVTPLGRFDDVIEFSLRADRGLGMNDEFVLWLSRGDGVIRLQFRRYGLDGKLVFGKVGGRTIVPH